MLFVLLHQLLFALVKSQSPKQKNCAHINSLSPTTNYSERLQFITNQVKPSFQFVGELNRGKRLRYEKPKQTAGPTKTGL